MPRRGAMRVREHSGPDTGRGSRRPCPVRWRNGARLALCRSAPRCSVDLRPTVQAESPWPLTPAAALQFRFRAVNHDGLRAALIRKLPVRLRLAAQLDTLALSRCPGRWRRGSRFPFPRPLARSVSGAQFGASRSEALPFSRSGRVRRVARRSTRRQVRKFCKAATFF